MKPRTTQVGAKEQNGDVEAANGALKRALEQALLVRGNRDFDNAATWQSFVDDVMRKGNRARGRRVAEDMEAMRELNAAKLPEFVEQEFCVSDWSTVRVKHCVLGPLASDGRMGARAHLRGQDRSLVRGQGAARM
jgi:hypothetical protein